MQFVIKRKHTNEIIAAGDADDGSVIVNEGNWYFEPEAVDMRFLDRTERTYNCPYKGICTWIEVDAPGVAGKNIAWVYENPSSGFEAIKGRIGFYTRETSGTIAEQR